ncbi:MAG: glycosyltransferase family 2 protein [Caldilineaceae bacterium]|nr:glycosyltransferase family 2 protein [Caldilineaceae bacterium]
MNTPLVSIVVPAYGGADYLGQAIDSVLGQTYPHFELIVVNDCSPDHTEEVVRSYADPRIVYLCHEQNRGAVAARNTGVEAARGDLIAYLDQDDYFHPEKLQRHVAYLQAFPNVGATYNNRFELNHSATTIGDIWRMHRPLTLADFVLGFPVAPSDLVLRREWAMRRDLWDERQLFHGGEIVTYGRLYLAGCQFGHVDRALTYHRYHSGRVLRNLTHQCQSYLTAQETIFGDARCPKEVIALRDEAFCGSYMVWSAYALAQEETGVAHELMQAAIALRPEILEGRPSEYINFLLYSAMGDDNLDHGAVLRRMLHHIPEEAASLRQEYPWAVARGHLLRGTRAIIWDRHEDGHFHFDRAAALGAQFDDSYVENLTHWLMNYSNEFGEAAAAPVVDRLIPYVRAIGGRQAVSKMKANYAVKQAFRQYNKCHYDSVPGELMRAFGAEPRLIANRGLISILLRSYYFRLLSQGG